MVDRTWDVLRLLPERSNELFYPMPAAHVLDGSTCDDRTLCSIRWRAVLRGLRATHCRHR